MRSQPGKIEDLFLLNCSFQNRREQPTPLALILVSLLEAIQQNVFVHKQPPEITIELKYTLDRCFSFFDRSGDRRHLSRRNIFRVGVDMNQVLHRRRRASGGLFTQ